MRLLATGDLHIRASGQRSDECCRILDWIADRADALRPDVVLCPGDVYDTASTPMDRLIASTFFLRLADVCPVIIIRGNHDQVNDLQLLGKLKSKHPITVVETAAVVEAGGAAIACVAWPNRASIAAMLGRPLGGEAVDDVARDAMRDVFRGLRDQLRDFDGPRILAGHFQLSGSVTSTGQPLIGGELSLGLEDLASVEADVVIMSHIHKAQDWDAGMPVVYCGSPFRTAFGETEPKSIVCAEWDGPRFVSWGRLETPARQMVLLNAQWEPTDAELQFSSEPIEPGAEVRLRYTVERDHREQAAARAAELREELLANGASVVQLDPQVIAHSRARDGADAVAKATSLESKLQHYWELRGDVPPAERQPKLFGKLGELRQ